MSTSGGGTLSIEKPPVKVKKETKEYGKSKNIDLETAKILHTLNEKANKKDFGKRIHDSEILAVAVRLITTEDIKKLQDDSLTANDRLGMLHAEYMKSHGKITLDQFLGKLIRKEI